MTDNLSGAIDKRMAEADITIGSFEHWGKTVGGALATAGITGFATNTASWLSYSEDDDGWGSHLIQLHREFGQRWFTVVDVADAVYGGHLKRPPVKRDPDRELASQLAYAYRTQRERWHGALRLIRSSARDGATGSYTWTVYHRNEKRENTAPDGENPSSVSSVSSAGSQETAGQTALSAHPEDEARPGSPGASSVANVDLQDDKTAGQTSSTEDTEDTEHQNRTLAPDFLSVCDSGAPCPNCGWDLDSAGHQTNCHDGTAGAA